MAQSKTPVPRNRRSHDRAPTVLLAHDGRPWTAELSAAAANGLRWWGCRVVDIGAATAAALVHAQLGRNADGAMLLGNSDGGPRQIGVALWRAGGQPCSAGGSLDAIQAEFDSPALPGRQVFGVAEHGTTAEEYLAGLEGFYHALRPLRFVLGCESIPLVRDLERLKRNVNIEVTALSEHGFTCGKTGPTAVTNSERSGLGRAAASLGRQVVAQGAHFGAWIDGDGECLRLFDECGAGAGDFRVITRRA